MLGEKDILRVLSKVTDPELGVNIVDLGLIYSTEVLAGSVRVVMTMTTPACPMHSYLAHEVQQAILDEYEEVAENVAVDLVWDPPWSPGMISEEGRRQLGWA
jgi:metal-sulfur cluster biosynthetic enzyme